MRSVGVGLNSHTPILPYALTPIPRYSDTPIPPHPDTPITRTPSQPTPSVRVSNHGYYLRNYFLVALVKIFIHFFVHIRKLK